MLTEIDVSSASAGGADASAFGSAPAHSPRWTTDSFHPEVERKLGPSPLATAFQGVVYSLVVFITLELVGLSVGQKMDTPYQVLALLASLLSCVGLRHFSLVTPWKFGRAGAEGNRLMATWAAIAGLLLLIGYGTQWSEYFSRQVVLLWFALTPAALVGLNAGSCWLLQRAVPELSAGRRAVMIYANDTTRRFAASAQRSKTFNILGYFEDRSLDRVEGGVPDVTFLGPTDAVADYVQRNGVEVVFIFLSQLNTQNAKPLLDALGDTTASVYYVPDFKSLEVDTRMISVESVPMLEVVETPFYGVDGLLKQIFDSSLAALALLVLSPLLLCLAALVKLSSEGPVIFRQKRYGLNGREFWIYKFRSMTVADRSNEIVQVSRDDQRVTPIGRFMRSTSLDELPQLINVVKGDMSLVGPRPHTVAHNEFYRRAVRRYMMRHKVKPGLTGLAQVNGFRGETAQLELMEQRIRYDLEYIKSWSPWLDIKILFKTVGLVLRRHNAY